MPIRVDTRKRMQVRCLTVERGIRDDPDAALQFINIRCDKCRALIVHIRLLFITVVRVFESFSVDDYIKNSCKKPNWDDLGWCAE